MNPKARDLVEELKKLQASTQYQAMMSPSRQASLMGELLVLLAEEQEKAAAKLEEQTLVLIRFTKLLVGLTWALVFIGIIQIVTMFWKP